MLTAVMYHYVRPLAQSAFPRLKALDLKDFDAQVSWIKAHHTLIGPADLRDCLTNAIALPDDACLLTFDDGYSDHYEHVAPILDQHNIKGLFFAPYTSLVERKMLEVNKIQLILASLDQPDVLADELDQLLTRHGLGDPQTLRLQYFTPNRYDAAPVAYAKRLLQHALPAETRTFAVDQLFSRHVSRDETGMAEQFYLTPAQAREMRSNGHEYGGHGDRHLWHAQINPTALDQEINGSCQALSAIGAPIEGGFYCYPFGNENQNVRDQVRKAGFTIGFSTVPTKAALSKVDPLAIPRLDTNDLPKTRE